jgi:hypothetical protein
LGGWSIAEGRFEPNGVRRQRHDLPADVLWQIFAYELAKVGQKLGRIGAPKGAR